MSRHGEPPVQLAAFVGREREVAEVRRLLGTTRLLTLTGAGGSGKTRLAIEVAQSQPSSWIELAGLGDPAFVPQHVAEQLGIREVRTGSMIDAIVEKFRDDEHLVVLDNCEHLVDAAARFVDALLRGCTRLQILATSREPLGLGGERAWLVPALSLPAREGGIAEPESYDALRLFAERARDVQPQFSIDDSNARTIAEICRRLDGLPLAIELAAARVRVLAPDQILARLQDTFRLLTGGSRTAMPRHQTLRATMDWSYALLAPDEQHLLDLLSVFAGVFTLEAAEATCADSLESSVLDVLARLVDRSLVVMHEVDGSARYALLEIVRQYAAERLRARGEEAAQRRRHAQFIDQLLAEAEPHFTRSSRPPWLARVHLDLDNVRAALTWTRDHEPERHLEMAGRLGWFWFSTGLWAEARSWTEGALALQAAGAPTLRRARALFSAALIACMQANARVAQRWLEEVVALARTHADAKLEAYANNYLGMALVQQFEPSAETAIQAAQTWFRAHHDLYGLRLSLLLLGTLRMSQRDFAAARTLLEEGVAVARDYGLPRELGIALQMLGSCVLHQGDYERAGTLFHDSVTALRRDPQFYFLARGLDMIAVLIARRSSAPADLTDAARLLGAGEALRRMIGAGTFQNDQQLVAPYIAHLRAALGDDAFERAQVAGRALSAEEALDHALARARARQGAPAVERVSTPSTSRPALVVRGLGPLEIACGDIVLARNAWTSARARELLLYLLCHTRGRRREDIGLVFWPDASAAQVKNSFHVLLHRLRKVLGRTDIVIVDDERYLIDPALEPWFDADVFEREVRAARRDAGSLETALALYRGNLFEGEVTGDWHYERQDRLRTQYRDALSTLADLRLEQGDVNAAIAVLERLITDDELREDGHRRLLLCYARTGQRARALQQYERLADVLREELDAVPSRTTRELADRIRRAEAV